MNRIKISDSDKRLLLSSYACNDSMAFSVVIAEGYVLIIVFCFFTIS